MQCFYRMVITLNIIKNNTRSMKKKKKKNRNMKSFSNLTSIAYPLLHYTDQIPLKKSSSFSWMPIAWELRAAICKATQPWGLHASRLGGLWKNNCKEPVSSPSWAHALGKAFPVAPLPPQTTRTFRKRWRDLNIKTEVSKSSCFLYSVPELFHTKFNSYNARHWLQPNN